MDGPTNQLNDASGGGVATGNPQNIGGQNLAAPQSNLQSSSPNLLNDSGGIRLTDQYGQPLILSSSTSQVAAAQPSSNYRGLMVIGGSGLIIAVLFVTTWFVSRKPT